MNLINIYELYRKHANKNDEMLKDINSLINNHDISTLFKKYGILEEIRNLYTKHGIPHEHVKVFLEVAEEQKAVISTRTPGPACGMLLKQGYDAKSFWVKSKSCDWGPMSGFVCLDPMLNKGRISGALDNMAYATDALTKVYETEKKYIKVIENSKDEHGNDVQKVVEKYSGVVEEKRSKAIQIRINYDRWADVFSMKYSTKDGDSSYYENIVVMEGGKEKAIGYKFTFNKLEILLKRVVKKIEVKTIDKKTGTESSSYADFEFYDLYYDVKKYYGIETETDANLYDELAKNFKKQMNEHITDEYPKDQAKIKAKSISADQEKKELDKLKEDKIKAEHKLEEYNEKFWKKLEDEKYLDPVPELQDFHNGEFKDYRPLRAMTNAHRPYTEDENANVWHLNALTGDYDLFAIWPQQADDTLDTRIAGMTQALIDKELVNKEEKHSVGKVVGNITERIYLIGQMINSKLDNQEITAFIKYAYNEEWTKEDIKNFHKDEPENKVFPTEATNRPTMKANRVYHSDEAGRPFVKSVDSAVGFGPNGEIFEIKAKTAAKDISDALIHFGKEGYACFINKGWFEYLEVPARGFVKYNKSLS